MRCVYRDRRVKRHEPIRWLLLPIVAIVSMAGCSLGAIPDQELRPSLAKIVAEVEFGEGRVTTFAFADGSALQLDLATVDALAGGQPVVNELLLYGTDPERGEWYVGLRGTADCFRITGPAEFRGPHDDDRMVFESGLSLPLADDFSPGRPSDPRVSERSNICVDENGEVVSYSTT